MGSDLGGEQHLTVFIGEVGREHLRTGRHRGDKLVVSDQSLGHSTVASGHGGDFPIGLFDGGVQGDRGGGGLRGHDIVEVVVGVCGGRGGGGGCGEEEGCSEEGKELVHDVEILCVLLFVDRANMSGSRADGIDPVQRAR